MNKRVIIDSVKIKAIIRQRRVTYKEVSEQTLMSEDLVKNVVTGRTKKITIEYADSLASALEVPIEMLIFNDADYSSDVPFEINTLVSNLYCIEKEAVFPTYTRFLHEMKKRVGFQNLSRQVKSLSTIVAQTRDSPDFSSIVKTMLETINDECSFGKPMFSAELFLSLKESECLAQKIQESLDYTSDTHRTFMVFFYCLILFEAMFWQELMMVSLHISPERAHSSGTVGKCAEIAENFRSIRIKMVDMIINGTYQFDDPNITSYGFNDALFECTQLLLMACNRCVRHFDDTSVASQYLNLSAMYEIREIVIKNCGLIGIDIYRMHPQDVMKSNFGIEYLKMRPVYQPAPDLQKKKSDHDKQMNQGIIMQNQQQQFCMMLQVMSQMFPCFPVKGK